MAKSYPPNFKFQIVLEIALLKNFLGRIKAHR
jgi:hypothetical protein